MGRAAGSGHPSALGKVGTVSPRRWWPWLSLCPNMRRTLVLRTGAPKVAGRDKMMRAASTVPTQRQLPKELLEAFPEETGSRSTIQYRLVHSIFVRMGQFFWPWNSYPLICEQAIVV
ncbi:unnamed protein product [Coccothraustes coccothraustes]